MRERLRLGVSQKGPTQCRSCDSVKWDDLIRELDRLQEATIHKDGKHVTTSTYVEGQVGRVFQAAGVALPPNLRKQPA